MYALVESKNSIINDLGIEIKGASYYLCDSVADISSLPVKDIGVGSRALVIPTGAIYMFGPSKAWVLYKGVSILN